MRMSVGVVWRRSAARFVLLTPSTGMSSLHGISELVPCPMTTELRRGMVAWAELDPVRGREQSGRRPVLVVASDLYLAQADTLAIIVPCTTRDRGWPNHVKLAGEHLFLPVATYAMTEQPRTVARERLLDIAGVVDARTMREVDGWLHDFLALP